MDFWNLFSHLYAKMNKQWFFVIGNSEQSSVSFVLK